MAVCVSLLQCTASASLKKHIVLHVRFPSQRVEVILHFKGGGDARL